MFKTFIILVILSISIYADDRPNILICISDDQSYAHTGANGDPVIKTPGFDRVASEGIRFTKRYCNAPSCGPSRSALLTGQHIWRLEEAGNIHSTLPAKFKTYTELLKSAGYAVGHTGKGWGPGIWKSIDGGKTKFKKDESHGTELRRKSTPSAPRDPAMQVGSGARSCPVECNRHSGGFGPTKNLDGNVRTQED